MPCCPMYKLSDESISSIKLVDFGSIPVDSVVEKYIVVENKSEHVLTYRVSLLYLTNGVDRVFKVSLADTVVKAGDRTELRIQFKPNTVGQSFTEYYIVDDSGGHSFRLTVTGKSFGPEVKLSEKKLEFRICKNVSEQRREAIKIVNKSSVDTTYQWLMPLTGQGFFQISTGNCGLIRAYETIAASVLFSGTALGVYTAELVCLVLNQEPLFLNVIATVVLPGNPLFNINDHVFEKNWKRKSRYTHLMENSLNRLGYIPAASVFERYLDFGMGSVADMTMNISQTLCVTNHEQEEGYVQWVPDADEVFLIDPIDSVIPGNESRLFTVRFRPKLANEVFGYLMCGDFQYKQFDPDTDVVKLKHTWFRIPCVGNTWPPCTQWAADCHCPTEVALPPTVPTRTTYTNFMLSNKLEIPMHYKFEAPYATNFVVMPMCGIVQSRGWQIISVALEPKSFGEYYETWDLVINKAHKGAFQTTRLTLCGNAEVSHVEVMSHGIALTTDPLYEFQPTITGCANYCTAYLHNLTRMAVHVRILNNVSWLGADNAGSFVLPPKEMVPYHFWFFPKTPNKVYETTITCSCVCLIDEKPVGEPTEIFMRIIGFSELPDLKMLPKVTNLHDIVVGESRTFTITLYNYGSCFFTSQLFHLIDGMGDDFSNDRLEIVSAVNTLKPSNHCEVTMTVTPNGAGARKIKIKYSVLYRTEDGEIEKIQPVTKTICTIFYDGIYPTLKVCLYYPLLDDYSHTVEVSRPLETPSVSTIDESDDGDDSDDGGILKSKVKRTISTTCPIILSNHCAWNILNVEELNKAFVDCRPNKPLSVNIFAPDLCVRTGIVEFILVIGCIYYAPVAWRMRREKICDCEMVEVQIGISTYEMRHTCSHRRLVELSPLSGIVTHETPNLVFLKVNYEAEGTNVLCYSITMPNQRTINLYINLYAHLNTKGILTPLRRPVGIKDYLAVLDCGRVPINNLDPVIRIVWLYNPTDVFTTWRLLRGNTISPDSVIRCLLYFAEVPPLGKLAIPFAFMPTEMVDYEVIFLCSFGYDTEKIKVYGQGGLPNCMETRLDIPSYAERVIRAAYRQQVVYLSKEHITIPIMPTHSLSRDIIALCNDTDSVIRFIWLPERIANIINVVMTPCWGVIQPKSTEWITMTVYTLQEPATFTISVACEILDLTERKRYQRNELLRRNKVEKCNQEFIITETGLTHPGINDSPPYVLDIVKPLPFYLSMTVSICSKGQRDGYPRMLLKQMWEQTPSYDLLSSDLNDYGGIDRTSSGNNMTTADIIRVIDGVLWDALHSKMFKNKIQYLASEEIPTYSQLVKVIETDKKPRLSRRVTSGICDAIVNKAVFHVYSLYPKHDTMPIFEAEE